jgi:predicted acylesterase/phospholipase RssA
MQVPSASIHRIGYSDHRSGLPRAAIEVGALVRTDVSSYRQKWEAFVTRDSTRYCDLVMKGGITSGVVYPNAVLALAREFRFKNIGGTSAGAIAAAISAAAALGDRKACGGQIGAHNATGMGFGGLQGVATQLATTRFIYSLFQPAAGARAAYRLVVTLAGGAGFARKLLVAGVSALAIAPIETAVVLALLLGIADWVAGRPGVIAALLPASLCAYATGALGALLRVARVARRNLLGLCSGMSAARPGGAKTPALTDWLHETLQALSGKPSGEPLTFNDLWTAPRYAGEPETARAITLQMITTSVSHHEPRTLPFANTHFWFRRDQFERLFPKVVVDWMVERAGTPDRVEDRDYYRFPTGSDLPVIVATRMSLSFPLLISAVPLHEPQARERPASTPNTSPAAGPEIDSDATILERVDQLADGGRSAASVVTAFRPCWFSDGGISSNFPIHLFDAPLPTWPTFAIDLVYPNQNADTTAGQPPVSLPRNNNEGWQPAYWPLAQRMALRELSGFVFGIIATMQNWRDLLLSRSPGQRERIVHVALDKDEGGMNLDMPQEVLDRVSAKGAAAGELFASFSFDNHYWIRWRNLASALQRYTIRVGDSVHSKPAIPAFENAYATARIGVPPPPSYKFQSSDRQAEAEKLLARLAIEGQEWEDLGPDLTTGAPRPLPQLQIAPVY